MRANPIWQDMEFPWETPVSQEMCDTHTQDNAVHQAPETSRLRDKAALSAEVIEGWGMKQSHLFIMQRV